MSRSAFHSRPMSRVCFHLWDPWLLSILSQVFPLIPGSTVCFAPQVTCLPSPSLLSFLRNLLARRTESRVFFYSWGHGLLSTTISCLLSCLRQQSALIPKPTVCSLLLVMCLLSTLSHVSCLPPRVSSAFLPKPTVCFPTPSHVFSLACAFITPSSFTAKPYVAAHNVFTR